MARIVRIAGVAGRAAFYVVVGVAGVVLIAQGEPIGWIGVGLAGAHAGLGIMSLRLGRRRTELAAREAIRRAEPGYIAPIIDPAESARRRTRQARIIVLGVIGPFLAIAITSAGIALVSTGDSQKWAIVIGMTMLLSVGAVALGLHRGLRKPRENS
jgi:hypothetical protein